jgi:hypothetical protein
MDWLGRDYDRFATRENGCRLRDIWITGAQVARLKHELSCEQILGVLGGEPAAILRNADGNYLILFFIDGIKNRRSREQ